MGLDQYTYELIDRYLEGGLSGKELADFETRMKDDGEFGSLVSLHKETVRAIKIYARSDQKKKLDSIRKQVRGGDVEGIPILVSIIGKLAVAASVLGVLSITAYWYFTREGLQATPIASYSLPIETVYSSNIERSLVPDKSNVRSDIMENRTLDQENFVLLVYKKADQSPQDLFTLKSDTLTLFTDRSISYMKDTTLSVVNYVDDDSSGTFLKMGQEYYYIFDTKQKKALIRFENEQILNRLRDDDE